MLKSGRSKLILLFAAVGILAVGVLGTSVLYEINPEYVSPKLTASPSYEPPAQSSTQYLESLSNGFIEIAEKVTPAVVGISSERNVKTSSQSFRFRSPWKWFDEPGEEGKKDDPFDFFGNVPEHRLEGQGTGMIVSPDGYILTNNHVVDSAEKVQVTLLEGGVYPAEIVGQDPTTDLAVIKIDRAKLPYVHLGDSDKTKIGEWVVAIGNPLGLNFTVTAGIVSAKERNINIIADSYGIESFIQTDAAINPGNSGGPLVNLKGEVIGINSAIQSDNGRFQGYGFAVPSSLAKRIMDELIEKGYTERAILGVSIGNVTPQLAKGLGLKEPRGVIVQDFSVSDSPAKRAGLEVGDVIIGIDGKDVKLANQLQKLVAFHKPGDKVTLTVLRDGNEKEITVKLGKREDKSPVRTVSRSKEDKGAETKLGVRVANITSQTSRQYQLEVDEGVVITGVARFSPAWDAGLREGDLILEVDRKKVNTASEFEEIVQKFDSGDTALLFINRQGNTFFTAVEIPEDKG